MRNEPVRKPRGAGEWIRMEARERLQQRGVDSPTIQQIIDAVDEVTREIQREVVQDLAQEEIDEVDRQRPLSCSSCSGRRLESKGRVAKTIVSLRGEFTVQRRRLCCNDCGMAVYPADEAVQVPDGSFTQAVDQRISRLGQAVPFAEAAELMEELLGVSVSTTYCRRQTEADGARFTPDDLLPERPESAPERVTIAIDGCFVPVRPEDAADRNSPFREVKLGAVTCEYRRPSGRLERAPIRYVGSVEPAEPFRQQLYALISRLRVHEATEITVVSDGAAWIRQFVTRHLSGIPRVVYVLDFWHASERIWSVARAVYGPNSRKATGFATRTVAAMRAGPPTTVLRRLKGLQPRSAEGRAARDEALGYFASRLSLMDYATFESAGRSIGSGTVESACKHVVKQRAAQAGMRWRIADWQKVMNLRIARRNDRWPSLNTRTQSKAA